MRGGGGGHRLKDYRGREGREGGRDVGNMSDDKNGENDVREIEGCSTDPVEMYPGCRTP